MTVGYKQFPLPLTVQPPLRKVVGVSLLWLPLPLVTDPSPSKYNGVAAAVQIHQREAKTT